MAFFTRSELRLEAQEIKKSLNKSASTVLHESFEDFSSDKEYDIFMAHSYLNADEILGLRNQIENMGFTVFVDWIEYPHLDRSQVTKETADLLRTIMNSSKSLFFATSRVSPDSKWMPWELGYFDGRIGKAAILPIMEEKKETNQYKGQEYLGLYPYVTKNTAKKINLQTLWIHENKDTYIIFEKWLEGKLPYNRSQDFLHYIRNRHLRGAR